ncbi:uncharacterized protein LOC117175109 isoform X2 [Belonocnema kinseyi]|uniref:uncharacterized protein LOC117175109 isoform X2 n=1 Tax=Belonocnema kinseyi TaxID=2817044 RepID=UPI00143DAAE8|nr:uncharacterized protein LOC117175109 isoform X2 [Belonocnema kinseyi]
MTHYMGKPICDDYKPMLNQSPNRNLVNEDAADLDWEKEHIVSQKLRDEMESMWELTKESFNITHLSMYEMERMFIMPKASKQLASIMTCLLSSPNLKSKLHQIPPMPYEFWTNVLMHKVRSWFKIYQTKHKNTVKVFEAIGVEPEFWNIFTNISCIDEKDFEKLSLKQRVWLLKTLCDTIMHTRKTVQEELSKQPWENKMESILGIDRNGARYIYFPQFLQNNLRVYRHCLDNKILSTVKSPASIDQLSWEVKEDNAVNCSSGKAVRNKRRKSRWRNGTLPHKGKKRKEREKRRKYDKLGDSSCSNGAVFNLLTNRNRNFNESTSFGNNNNIDCNLITPTCSRSMSKTSVENSSEFKWSSVTPSRYEISKSINIKYLENEMLKGFKSEYEEESNSMKVICEILHELTSKIERNLDGLEKNTTNSGTRLSEEKMLQNSEYYSQNVNKIISKKASIIDVEIEMAQVSVPLKFGNDKLPKIMSADKDDDIGNEDLQNDEVGLDKWLNALTKKKLIEAGKEITGNYQTDKESENKCSKSIKKELRCNAVRTGKLLSEIKQYNETANNVESEYEASLKELRDALINEASLDDFSSPEDFTNGSYNFRKIPNVRKNSWNVAVEDFNEMLTDLSISNFEIVANSVETLRNFIEDFSHKENDSAKSNNDMNTFIPICEVNLIRKMSDLLKSVESMETSLKDSTKKARSKLQREWLNFKNGAIEEKVSSDETSITSNWWIFGSQGSTLAYNKEATLHTMSHSVLSPSGCQNQIEHSDSECDKLAVHQVQKQKPKFNEEEEDDCRRKGIRNFNNRKEREQEETEDGEGESEELKQQTKRVLRARGISSYTEQPLSDNSEAEELERWTDLEAIYSVPSVQMSPSSPHALPQSKKCDKRSDTEDSDQEWILPSSRKKRNKRPSASRRLKSFQNKLQTIKVNSNLCSTPNTASFEVADEKDNSNRSTELDTKQEIQSNISENRNASTSRPMNESKTVKNESSKKIVPSGSMICKVECVDSVHSELDIKDEEPIIDSMANNYNINVQQNYVVVKSEPPPVTNYYVMQQNPPITGVVQRGPFIQQAAFVQSGIPQAQPVHSVPSGYYVQSTPNYVVQSSQSGYGPPRHPVGLQPSQQMVIQQTPQIIGAQQVITPPNYVQYMVNNLQQSVLSTSLSNPRMAVTQRPNYTSTHLQPRGQLLNQHNRMGSRCPQNRMSRQNLAHPNGAVIRSMPLTGNGARFPGARNMAPRNIVPRQNARHVVPRLQKLTKINSGSLTATSQNTTSLIVLSDSDDEIEMIITEKPNAEAASVPSASSLRKNVGQPIERRKPIVTSEVTVSNPKSTLPPQIVQRMSQGGISITPVKTNPPANPNTQLVVVVNETGSHYALALPNGSKLILTPEQVAQIRASNGGKLIL